MPSMIPFDSIKASITLSKFVCETVSLKKSGRELSGLCPFHNEKTASFFVNDAEGFYHCFGCGSHGDVFDWLRLKKDMDAQTAAKFLGYENDDNKTNGHAKTNGHDDGWQPLPVPDDVTEPDLSSFDHIYRYTDATGRLQRFITRKNAKGSGKKTFVPFTWGVLDGRLGWHHRHASAPRGLYNLPQVEAQPDALVVVCEGEKAADAAHVLFGLPCVTWSGGTASTHTADWQSLIGRDVVVWPDNDLSGHKAAAEIITQLVGVAKSIFLLEVLDLPDKHDAADLTADTPETWFHTRIRSAKIPNGMAPPWSHADDPGPSLEDQPGDADLDWQWGQVGATGPAVRWPVPLDIFQAETETTPRVTEKHLPARLWPFINDTSIRMGVDPTTVALGSVVTCASVIHDDWRIQPKRHDRTWTESARLWGCIVGDPSSMKSPVIMACTRVIDRLEAESRRRHNADMEIYEERHATWKKAKNTEEPEPRRPKLSRYLVEGATMEAFQEVLRDDPKAQQQPVAGKVLCRQDEMSEWAGNLDRYSGGKGGGDRGAYLRLYNGGRYTIDRVGRGSFAVSNWSACLLTGCQPEPIQKIARDAAEDGLLQRFMYAVPPPAGDGVDQEEDEEALEEYQTLIRSLTAMHPLTKESGYGHEHLAFHALAHVHREAIDKAAKAIALMPGTSNRVKSTLGKWPGLFARICLTFHMVEHAGRVGVPYVIAEETAERVKNYMLEIILPHLIRADAVMFLTPQTGHARWIAGHILAHGSDIITTRDVVHAYRALRSPEQARELATTMASLVAVGWLDPMQPRNPLSPVSSWRVNPDVHTRFVERARIETEGRESVREAIREGAERYVPIGFSVNGIEQ